jgi:bis(5'-nucleosidyl)-tetraphosphatase
MKSISPSESEEGEERAAGFVLFRIEDDDRQYLLLRHRYDGQWGLPKGKIEPGENEFEAAVREIAEETSIEQLDAVPEFRETSNYCFERDGRQTTKSVVYYLAETAESEVCLSDEHTDFQWLPFEDAIDTLTYEETRRVLSDADELLTALADAEEAEADS